MPRLTRKYARTGDAGATSLGGGRRVAKDSPRIEAIGALDELNSALGVCLAQRPARPLAEALDRIQNDLFHLGADLCFRQADKRGRRLPRVEARHVRGLEKQIDKLVAELGPLGNFILPGGSPAAAQLHLARAVCRRAERCVARLMRRERIGPHVLPYLNRLGTLLFAMARYENRKRRRRERPWNRRA